MAIVSNIQDELDALGAHITTATTAAITRPVVVLTDPYDRFYGDKAGDTFPFVLVQEQDFRMDRLYGGVTGMKGQKQPNPNWYTILIQDLVAITDTSVGVIAASRRDIRALIAAIVLHFDHAPNRALTFSKNSVSTDAATLAGEHIRFRFPPGPFGAQAGESTRVIAAGMISVIGQPHPGMNP